MVKLESILVLDSVNGEHIGDLGVHGTTSLNEVLHHVDRLFYLLVGAHLVGMHIWTSND